MHFSYRNKRPLPFLPRRDEGGADEAKRGRLQLDQDYRLGAGGHIHGSESQDVIRPDGETRRSEHHQKIAQQIVSPELVLSAFVG